MLIKSLALFTALVAGAAGVGHAASAPQTFDSNGVKLSYVVEGKGDAVVLIHGLHSSVLMNWQLPGTVAQLAKNHQVIALDLPGHGFSEKPEKESAYGLEMVEDVRRLLDKLQIKQAHIVGYSMGGMIAAKFIAKYPERVLSGTLGGMGWLRDGSLLQRVWEGMGKGSSAPAACTRSLGTLALSDDELQAIKVPVTVLVGERDPCRMMYVAPLQKARPDWTVIEIKGAGHLDCVVNAQFKDELQKWIEKQRSR